MCVSSTQTAITGGDSQATGVREEEDLRCRSKPSGQSRGTIHSCTCIYTQLNHTHQPTMECYTFSPSSNRLSLTQQVAQEKETTESKWKQERQRRIRTEKRLRLAEDSLKRLDKALKESGVQIDIQIETDVKHLKSK